MAGEQQLMRCMMKPLLGFLLLAVLSTPTWVGAAEDDTTAFALFKECVQKIHQEAYKQEAVAVIITKALHGLVQALGDGYSTHDQDLSKLPDAAAETAFEAELREIAATPGQRRGMRDLAETALQCFCKQHDPFTRYVRSEDWKLAQLMSRTTGSGVGMTVNEKKGIFYCYPLPGSSAEVAGVKPGDKLLAVDGKPLDGKPLEYVAGVMKGSPGSEVILRLERTYGRAQSVKVVREAMSAPLVLVEKKVSGVVLRIRKFGDEVIPETRKALADLSPGGLLTLDMRGCPGGNLETAVEFASLFLEPKEPVVTLRSRGQPDEVMSATKPREFKVHAITLIQDEGTASAAELVITALIHSPNNRASSQGTKTYGKGVFQTPFDLSGGGHLVLTTGETIAPQGRGWSGIGLLPSIENDGRIFPKE